MKHINRNNLPVCESNRNSRRLKHFFSLFALVFIFGNVSAQLGLEEVDSNKIVHRTLRDLLNIQKIKGNRFFNQLSASCYDSAESVTFSIHKKSYEVTKNLDEVWQGYKSANPSRSWSGKMVNFGFLYSRLTDHIYYSTDEYQGLEEGQIIFLNLRIFNGIKNLGVAFQITEVNEEEKIIRFCYLKNGKSEGTQTLRFEKSGEGNTIIHHETQYRSNSSFRDHWFYPKFHTDCIGEFHQNIRKWIDELGN